MEALLQWGIDLITAIQQIQGPVLNTIFRVVTFMGDEEFYLLFLPLLLWCVNFGLGARIGVLFLLSSFLTVGLKDLLQQPRPFDLDPGVKIYDAEGYGLPSYHSQSSVVVWGGVATWARKTWFWVVAIVVILLVSFSRVYLGVHFPTDLLAGWAIGIILLVIYQAVQPAVEKRLIELRLGWQLLLAVVVPVLLLLIHPVKNTTTAMAALAGVGVGLALRRRYVSFSTDGPWWQRALRFLIGGTVVFAFYLGLEKVLPGEGSSLYLILRFLGVGLVGVWISLGGPWLFRRVRLAPEG